MDKYFTSADQRNHIARIDAIGKSNPELLTNSERYEYHNYMERAKDDAMIWAAKEGDNNAKDSYLQKHGIWKTWLNIGF